MAEERGSVDLDLFLSHRGAWGQTGGEVTRLTKQPQESLVGIRSLR